MEGPEKTKLLCPLGFYLSAAQNCLTLRFSPYYMDNFKIQVPCWQDTAPESHDRIFDNTRP